MTTESASELVGEVEAQTDKLVQSLVPYLSGEEEKASYLGFRASGFTSTEALGLVKRTRRTLLNWRKDPQFCHIEDDLLPKLRQVVGKEIISMEFIRNYRLILIKDYRIIKKSLEEPQNMSRGELDYLFKARVHYTPQQLAVLEQLFSPTSPDNGSESAPKSFGEYVLALRRTRTQVDELIIPAGGPQCISDENGG